MNESGPENLRLPVQQEEKENLLGLAAAPGHDAEARERLSQAATQGQPDAQFNLGNLCHSISLRDRAAQAGSAGRVEAYMWYHLAATQGHVGAAAACETLNLQLSDIELQEGNRRANAFQRRDPAPPAPNGS
jgi:TPR repeat protein